MICVAFPCNKSLSLSPSNANKLWHAACENIDHELSQDRKKYLWPILPVVSIFKSPLAVSGLFKSDDKLTFA
jgi:hypothetical protein